MESSLVSSEHFQFLNQFWWSLFILVPMVLIARTAVTGTRYSPILIIVIFGLLMGFVLVSSGVSTAGLPDFPLLNILSRTTIVALGATFFVGGQQLRRVFSKNSVPQDDSVIYCTDEVVLGTGRTQFVFIIRAFFLLLGVEALTKYLLGITPNDELGRFYPLIALVFAMPFLVHPLVFFLFGRAMEKDGEMPRLPVYVLAGVGVAGVLYGLLWM